MTEQSTRALVVRTALAGALAVHGMTCGASLAQTATDASASPSPSPRPQVTPDAETSPAAPQALVGASGLDAERAAKEAELRRRLVPPPSDSGRLAELATLLEIAEDDRPLYDSACQAYERAHARARELRLRKFDILLPAAFRFDSVARDFEPVYTPELMSALSLRAEMLEMVLGAEEELDRTIDNLCPQSKRSTWRAIRLQRAKELYDHPARLPAANVNLLELIPRCGLTPDELTVLEPFFETYSRDLLAELRARHVALESIMLDRTADLVQLGPEWRAGRTEQEAFEVDRELAKLDVAETLADFGMRNVNERGLSTVRKALNSASARKVVEAYRRVVHPELYEDERSHRLLVEEMIGLPSLDQQSIGGIVASLTSVEERLRPFGEQAADLADGIIAAESLASRDAASARVLLQSKLQSVLEKRRRVVRDGIQMLRSIVPTSEEAFAAKLDDAIHTLAALDRAGRFLRDSLDSRAAEVALLEAMEQAQQEAERDEGLGATDPGAAPPPETQMTAPPQEEPAQAPPEPPPPRRGRGSRGSW